eukprot:s36_g40.t1
MLNQLDTNDADFDVACRWLHANEKKWKTWLPESGKCLSQFGMYSEKDEKFLQAREEALACFPCREGIDCPFSSSVQALLTGQPSSSEQLETRIQSGYFATVTAQATPFKTFQMAVGLAVNVLQSLALFGLMSAKWPETFEMAFSRLQIFVLDIEGLSLGCLIGGTSALSYVATTLICPLILLWLGLCNALSHSSCSRMCGLQRWKWPFTFNTMGLCLQLGFGTMAAVALKPMMCYKHPNGRHSVLNYPGIFCGDGGHGLLLSFGIASLIVFVVGFLVLCSYAVWKLPRWSVEGEHDKVQSFRFCTWNFRPDTYGFILPILCRGLGFAIAVVAGTNAPPVQTAVTSMVLIIYLVAQALLQPWKAPAINVADTVFTASLLTLASRSLQVDSKMEAKFAEYFAAIVLMLLT